jgi:hypothetical protein
MKKIIRPELSGFTIDGERVYSSPAEELEHKIYDRIESLIPRRRGAGRPSDDDKIKEFTTYRIWKSILDLNPPDEIKGALRKNGRSGSLKNLKEQIRVLNEKYYKNNEITKWCEAISGVIFSRLSRNLPVDIDSEIDSWNRIAYCDYCWRFAPLGSKQTYKCILHMNSNSEYMKAYRAKPKIDKKRREIRKNYKNSLYFSNGELDIENPGFLLHCFPVLSKYLFEMISSNPNNEYAEKIWLLISLEGDKNISVSDCLLALIKFIDDKEDPYDIRNELHNYILHNNAMLMIFLTEAEAWISIYEENKSNKGGKRKGSGRPRLELVQ